MLGRPADIFLQFWGFYREPYRLPFLALKKNISNCIMPDQLIYVQSMYHALFSKLL